MGRFLAFSLWGYLLFWPICLFWAQSIRQAPLIKQRLIIIGGSTLSSGHPDFGIRAISQLEPLGSSAKYTPGTPQKTAVGEFPIEAPCLGAVANFGFRAISQGKSLGSPVKVYAACPSKDRGWEIFDSVAFSGSSRFFKSALSRSDFVRRTS